MKTFTQFNEQRNTARDFIRSSGMDARQARSYMAGQGLGSSMRSSSSSSRRTVNTSKMLKDALPAKKDPAAVLGFGMRIYQIPVVPSKLKGYSVRKYSGGEPFYVYGLEIDRSEFYVMSDSDIARVEKLIAACKKHGAGLLPNENVLVPINSSFVGDDLILNDSRLTSNTVNEVNSFAKSVMGLNLSSSSSIVAYHGDELDEDDEW